MTRESIERFARNLTSAVAHCVQEDFEVFPEAAAVLACIGFLCMFWVAGVVVYDLIVDPHFTAASLGAVSISPDKWPR